MEKPSFIVTGASASGKSTLIKEAMEAGYQYLPTHTTREIRPNEVNGVDSVFLSRELFEQNFKNGLYLEPSLEYTELKSIKTYYGTPREWLNDLTSPEHCASPVAIQMARKVFELLDIEWVHLVCDEQDRYKRLSGRGYSEDEISKRMKSGESIIAPNEAVLYNSSELKPVEILNKIRRIK